MAAPGRRLGRWSALMVSALLMTACVNARIPQDDYVLALQGSRVEVLARMFDSGAAPLAVVTPDGRNILMIMAGAGEPDYVKRLLQAGVPVDQTNARGGSALMYGAVSGDSEVVDRLMWAGADVNAVARNGWTAISLAAAKGHSPIVRKLLAAGADPNIPDMYGWTPLLRAVENGKLETVEVLLQAPGLAIDAVNDNGASALFRATVAGSKPLVALLLRHGANPRLEDFEGRSPLTLARQLDRPDLEALMLHGGAEIGSVDKS